MDYLFHSLGGARKCARFVLLAFGILCVFDSNSWATHFAILANRTYVGSEASGNCAWEPERVQAILAPLGTTELFEAADATSIAARLSAGQMVVIPDMESGSLAGAWGANATVVRAALQAGGQMLVFGDDGSNDVALINTMISGASAEPLSNLASLSGSVSREPTYPAEFATAPATLNWVNGTYFVSNWNVGTVVYRNGTTVGAAIAPIGQGRIGFIAYDFYCPGSSAAGWTSVTQAMAQHLATPTPGPSSQVIGFDDLPAPNPATVLSWGNVPRGYGGFDWSASAYCYRPFEGITSGYANGVVSGSQGGFTAYASPVTITRPTRWTFRGAYFTAAWNVNLNVRVTATRGGRVVYDQTRVLGAPTGPQYLSFDYFDIDSITITPSGGTNYGFGYDGAHLAIDNFTYSAVVAQVIEFEDISITGTPSASGLIAAPIPTGYFGFDWSVSARAYRAIETASPSGYLYGLVSGSQGGFTAYAETVTVSRSSRWNFHGAYFTAGWNTGLNVRVRGFRGGVPVYDQTRVLGAPIAPTYLAFDYVDIDSIEIDPSGGTDYPPYIGAGEHLAIDDFAFSVGASSPTVSLVSSTPATCGLPNGAIDISVTNASSVSWTGPGGFTSTNEDISGLAAGSYTVTASGSGGNVSLNVTVSATADTEAPVVTGFTPVVAVAAGASCSAAMADFRSSVTATDNCAAGALSVTQSPEPGTLVGLGSTAVLLTVTDAAGNSSQALASFVVNGVPQQYYLDADGDGVGAGAPVTACVQPSGYATTGGDGCPEDPAKLSPGFCGCGVADVDLNGNGILDCADVYVTMSAPDGPLAAGGTFVVRVSSTSSYYALTGVQLAVEFDASHLQLLSVVPVAGTPFILPISEQSDNSAGTLLYAAGVDPSGPGSTSAAELVDLVFAVRTDVALCGESVLSRFGTVGGFSSRFSRSGGSFLPVTSGLAARQLDTLAPALSGVPSDVTLATDAGSTVGAYVADPAVTAVDACDGSLAPSLQVGYPNGTTGSSWPFGGIFPIGTTTLTWSVSDAQGNSVSSSSVVTVLPHQLLDAGVCFSGTLVGASTRSVRLTVGGLTQVREVSLSGSCGDSLGIEVPVSSGYSCATAKDPVHSLTSSGSVSISGRRYTVDFALRQGDSNDDDAVDIVDFGLFVDDFGADRGPASRSNFNADTLVNNGDFSFIAIHFFRVGEDCAGGLTGRSPRGAVRVKELRRKGLGHLAVADLNQDGWVDARDVQAYLQNGLPPAAELSAGHGIESTP